MKWFAWLALPLVACGSVSEKPDARTADSPGSGSDSAVDTMPDSFVPRCNPTSAFQTPTALTTLNSGAREIGAGLSADELTIYFGSERTGGPGNGDLWYATRTSRTAAWATPALLPGVDTATNTEFSPSVTGDGLTLYIDERDGGGVHIAIATRASTSDNFNAYSIPGSPLNIAGGGVEIADGDPYVLPDHSAMYFVSTRYDPSYTTTHEDILRATRTNGVWSVDGRAPGIPTAALEVNPVVSPDDLTMYYESYSGNGDIYIATRANKADPFGSIQAQTSLNTAGDEGPNYITADGCELYFERDGDLFVAKRGM